MDMVTWSKLNP